MPKVRGAIAYATPRERQFIIKLLKVIYYLFLNLSLVGAKHSGANLRKKYDHLTIRMLRPSLTRGVSTA
jgi:hypothetical protein